MNLENIRKKLVILEDIIIKNICNRVNYKLNKEIYIHNSDKFKFLNNFEGTYFDFLFKHMENVQSMAGRYEAFDEKPYYKGLEKTKIEREYENTLPSDILKFSNKVNFNAWIRIAYLNFIQNICIIDNDNNYGDTVLCDINCLQAISKRIHYGILVMEAKYKESKSIYDKYLNDNDDVSIIAKLKNKDIENKVLQRVKEKAIKYKFKNPEQIVNFFKNFIIPMTIQVELEYVFTKNE